MANLSFQDAEKIIRENPKQADALAFEAREFLKTHPEVSPADLPQPILDGKAISEAYSYLREQHEDSQMGKSGEIDRSAIPEGLAGAPLLALAFLQRPKTMREDRDYQKIEEKLKKEWLKNNNAKDFSSKEGLDYLYGSYDDKTKTSIHKEAEEAFRNNPKFQKKVERYDKEQKKIYKNHEDDPKWQEYGNSTQSEIKDRIELLEKKSKYTTPLKLSEKELGEYQNEIAERVRKKTREEFEQKNPEQAKKYFEKIDAERRKREEKTGTSNISMPSSQGATTNISSPTTSQAGQLPSPSFPSGKRGIPKKSPLKNPLKGIENPFGFGKIGSKTAGKVALRGLAAFLFNPVVIALALIVIATFAIVLLGVAPGAPSSPESTTTAPAAP